MAWKVIGGYPKEEVIKVVRISVEVHNGSARLEVVVRAESIRRAVGLVAALYPEGDVRVIFPIHPESFFVEDPTARAGMAGLERPPQVAA